MANSVRLDLMTFPQMEGAMVVVVVVVVKNFRGVVIVIVIVNFSSG